jgi:hypothetical protein
MKPPLVDVSQYISFEGLRDALAAAQDYIFRTRLWVARSTDQGAVFMTESLSVHPGAAGTIRIGCALTVNLVPEPSAIASQPDAAR